MRRTLFALSSLLSACTASANLPSSAPEDVAAAASSDIDGLRAQVDGLDASLRALRRELAASQEGADVTAQALDVQADVVATMLDLFGELDERVDRVDEVAASAFATATWSAEGVDGHDGRIAELDARAADTLARLAALEGGSPTLKPVDIDSAPCGLLTESGGVIYRVAPDLRPGELLLRATDAGDLRIETPSAVACGASTIGPDGEFETAPAAVVEGAVVYVLPEAGGWFHVGS